MVSVVSPLLVLCTFNYFPCLSWSLWAVSLSTDWLVLTVVSQDYYLEAGVKNVILGNSVILKCEVPSFVSDFVHVTAWVEETSAISYFPSSSYGTNIAYICLGRGAENLI